LFVLLALRTKIDYRAQLQLLHAGNVFSRAQAVEAVCAEKGIPFRDPAGSGRIPTEVSEVVHMVQGNSAIWMECGAHNTEPTEAGHP
jgi:hypothetical protein